MRKNVIPGKDAGIASEGRMKTPDSSWVPSVMADYEKPLSRCAARITGDVERAREVVQDTFLRLWRNGLTPFAATVRSMCAERRDA